MFFCCCQGKVHTERPKNVLEMMKEWRNDMEECREEEEDSQHGSSMNGKETTTSGNTRKTSVSLLHKCTVKYSMN